MVTPVACPPADTARYRRHPPCVFCAEWPLQYIQTTAGLQNNTVSLTVFHREIAQTVAAGTVAAVLVTSTPPCFRVTFVAVPPAFTCSLPFWLTVVKFAPATFL